MLVSRLWRSTLSSSRVSGKRFWIWKCTDLGCTSSVSGNRLWNRRCTHLGVYIVGVYTLGFTFWQSTLQGGLGLGQPILDLETHSPEVLHSGGVYTLGSALGVDIFGTRISGKRFWIWKRTHPGEGLQGSRVSGKRSRIWKSILGVCTLRDSSLRQPILGLEAQ